MAEMVLVLGASGMLGNAVLRYLVELTDIPAAGTARSAEATAALPTPVRERVITGVSVDDTDQLVRLMAEVRPTVVINCIGVVKQLAESNDPLVTLPLNALLPHRLARLCDLAGARLVHVSTDCVFTGKLGDYTEADTPDAYDLYGRSKLLGEVDYPNAVTLRTSIIGHELQGSRSLVDWFLSQSGPVRGFRKAIFSGLPTVEVARIIVEHVMPDETLRGLYHLSAEPINKYELLKLLASAYGRNVEIDPDDTLVIDRSLDSSRFRAATGYAPEPWPRLVEIMRDFG